MNETTSNNNRIRIGDRVTIYQRGKKQIYVADFWVSGEHQRQSLKTRNFRIAHQRAIALEARLTEGTHTPLTKIRNGISLRTAIDEFLGMKSTDGRRSKTVTKYRGVLLSFCEFAVNQRIDHLDQIDLPLFDRFRAWRIQSIGQVSLYNDSITVKTFLRWCADRSYILANPLAPVRFKKPKREPKGGPSLDQVNLILANSPTRLIPVFSLLAFTGRRAGDCQRILMEDVDFGGNWIHIVSRPGAETKSGNSRDIPIHPRLRIILERLPKTSRKWFFTAQPSHKYPGGGNRVNMKHANEYFQAVLEKLGIRRGKKNKGFTLHSLRSFFKTFAINAGIPREVVDHWMDHASHRPNAGDGYYSLSDEESQRFMRLIPFGDGEPAADAGAT